MGRATGVEGHPQRVKIIEAIIAGESADKIAGWAKPALHKTTIWRYARNVVQPTLQKHATSATPVAHRDPVSELTHRNTIPAEVATATKEEVVAAPILAVREKRVQALQDRWDRLNLVMQERAQDMAAAPGGKSGLLVRQYKQVGQEKVEEYKLDTGLLAEFRAHEEQVARELGQWQESSPSGPDVNVQILLSLPRGGPDRDVPVIDARPRRAIGPGDVLEGDVDQQP